MIQIDEERIRAAAPNPAAAENGRGLTGQFTELMRDADGVCFWGLCAGSGKNPYRVSADFFDEARPSFACSCPSRQFPCKHVLGLLYCVALGKKFEVAPLPEEIVSKREKRVSSPVRAKPAAPAKTNTAALVKKMRQQLDGLDTVRQFLDDVLKLGFASCSPKQVRQWEAFAKGLESCYLTGPQTEVRRLLGVLSSGLADEEKFRRAAVCCGKLHALCKKGTEFLQAKCASDSPDYEDSEVYELLGYNWKLEQLKNLGLVQENAALVQLAFVEVTDEAAAESVQIGFWAELTGGTLEQAKNYVPFKASKYVARTDSDFAKHNVAELYRYPGGRRVRWEGGDTAEVSAEDLARILALASPSAQETVKDAKNKLKAPLAEDWSPALLKAGRVLGEGEGYALETADGTVLRLADYGPFGASCRVLAALPESACKNAAVFGVFFRWGLTDFAFMPLSVVTDGGVKRLLY